VLLVHIVAPKIFIRALAGLVQPRTSALANSLVLIYIGSVNQKEIVAKQIILDAKVILMDAAMA